MNWQHSGEALRKYDFTYDRINRLLHARMPGAAFEERGITYDDNGNIRMLTRTENGVVVDSMLYSYMGNRLQNVRDYSTTPGVNDFRDNGNMGTGQEYSYDGNGNMNADVNKGIVSIAHNLLNQPKVIDLGGGKRLEYVYTASGVKLRRRTFNGAAKDSTDYINGMQYEGGILDMYPHAEGYVKVNPNSTFQYNYTLKDHLGNTRVVLAQDGSVLQRNNYYPFGKSIDAWDYSGPGSAYKYNYNGKELQNQLGLNWHDYGWRMYDASLGRWNVIDQLAVKYHTTSPYAFVANNPISRQEIDGRYFDEKNEKKAAKIEKRAEMRADKLEARAEKMEAKGKSSGDLRQRTTELRKSAGDIKNMRSDLNTEYKYGSLSSREGRSLKLVGPTTTLTGQNSKGDNVVTMFTQSSMSSMLHESRHGGQNARGEFNVKTTMGYGVADEISAYKAEYSWNGQLEYRDQPTESVMKQRLSAGQDPTKATITNINEINKNVVNSMVDPGFNPIYPPRDSRGNLIIPIDAWDRN